MTKQKALTAAFVDVVPDMLTPGVIYISRRFATASHLCCCGCGHEVVTPLNPAKWRLTERDGVVSLHPSIGNWSLPCRSHYVIDKGEVQWADQFNSEQIALVQARDRLDAIAERPVKTSKLAALALAVRYLWQAIRGWWRG